MPKCKIKVRIQNPDIDQTKEVDAILLEDTIKYLEEGKTHVTYSYQDNSLIRENKELKMIYSFDQNTGTVEIKEYRKTFDIPLKVHQIKKEKYDVEIQFLVEENPFLYKIEVIK